MTVEEYHIAHIELDLYEITKKINYYPYSIEEF
jgi:hypothetical protein